MHASATVCAKPPPEATEIVYVAVCPGITVADVTPAVTEKSGPLPASDTICGLPVALSLTASVALRAPIPVGLKITLIWQFVPAASAALQVLVCEKSPALVPLMAIVGMFSEAMPVLVSVATCGELGLPIACCVNVSVCGASEAVVVPADAATVSVTTRWCVGPLEVPTIITG